MTAPGGAASPAAETVPIPVVAPATAAAPAKPRQGWADIAKGVCIILVVLWHVVMKMYLAIDWHLPVPLPGLWGAFGEMLLPLRMPVFFMISGMFALSATRRPWSVVARSRIAQFYYLYLLWFVVHTTVLAMVPDFDTLAAHSALDVLEQITITPTNLWYLFALALYFVVAKVTRDLPSWAVLVPAAALSAIASAGLLAAPGNRGQLYQNLVFFLIGLRFRPLIEKWARTATTRHLLVCAGVYVVLMLAIRVTGTKYTFGVWPAVCLLALALGVAGAVQLERLRRVGPLLSRLGQQTLPIYVIHMPLLALVAAALVGPFSALGTGPQLALAVLLPVVLTAVLVSVCLTLHTWLLSAGATWMFELPRFSRRDRAVGGPPPR